MFVRMRDLRTSDSKADTIIRGGVGGNLRSVPDAFRRQIGPEEGLRRSNPDVKRDETRGPHGEGGLGEGRGDGRRRSKCLEGRGRGRGMDGAGATNGGRANGREGSTGVDRAIEGGGLGGAGQGETEGPGLDRAVLGEEIEEGVGVDGVVNGGKDAVKLVDGAELDVDVERVVGQAQQAARGQSVLRGQLVVGSLGLPKAALPLRGVLLRKGDL